jgi:hypothetical protein
LAAIKSWFFVWGSPALPQTSFQGGENPFIFSPLRKKSPTKEQDSVRPAGYLQAIPLGEGPEGAVQGQFLAQFAIQGFGPERILIGDCKVTAATNWASLSILNACPSKDQPGWHPTPFCYASDNNPHMHGGIMRDLNWLNRCSPWKEQGNHGGCFLWWARALRRPDWSIKCPPFSVSSTLIPLRSRFY